MKLKNAFAAALIATTPIAANAQTSPPPVKTDASLNDFFTGKADKITCTSNGQSVQIVPLENDPGNKFVAIEGKQATPLKDRQAGVNACLNLGLGK